MKIDDFAKAHQAFYGESIAFASAGSIDLQQEPGYRADGLEAQHMVSYSVTTNYGTFGGSSGGKKGARANAVNHAAEKAPEDFKKFLSEEVAA